MVLRTGSRDESQTGRPVLSFLGVSTPNIGEDDGSRERSCHLFLPFSSFLPSFEWTGSARSFVFSQDVTVFDATMTGDNV